MGKNEFSIHSLLVEDTIEKMPMVCVACNIG